MKLGFLTACLPDRSLDHIVEWAAAAGYEALEVAAWPALGARPFTATHIAAETLDRDTADAIRARFDSAGLSISSLAVYDNNLHPDATERAAINDHVLACIDAAALLGCPTVGTFVGRDPSKSVSANLAEAEEVFKEFYCNFLEGNLEYLSKVCGMAGLAIVKGDLKRREVEGWKHKYNDILDLRSINFLGG